MATRVKNKNVIKTKFISQERYDLLRRLVERSVSSIETEGWEGAAAYGDARLNGTPRVYLIYPDGRIFNPWLVTIYRPLPEKEVSHVPS